MKVQLGLAIALIAVGIYYAVTVLSPVSPLKTVHDYDIPEGNLESTSREWKKQTGAVSISWEDFCERRAQRTRTAPVHGRISGLDALKQMLQGSPWRVVTLFARGHADVELEDLGRESGCPHGSLRDVRDFDIPAGPLRENLSALREAAELGSLYFLGSKYANVMTLGVHGRMTALEAAETLVHNTGLVVSSAVDGALIVKDPTAPLGGDAAN
jgi:hypothetical protein